MHTRNLYERVLVPPSAKCNELVAVSGYVSGHMAKSHMFPPDSAEYDGLPDGIRFRLVYGMYPAAGIDPGDYKFLIQTAQARRDFLPLINQRLPPVHAKVYVWLAEDRPVLAFAGSANYSINAFFGKTVETVAEVDPGLALQFCEVILGDAKPLAEVKSPDFRSRVLGRVEAKDESAILEARLSGFEAVELPLYVVAQNRIHEKSGLNWGQRPGREPNQAYIPIPASVTKTGFFPPRQTYFTLLTDDGEVFECVIAQDNDKAIETPANNSVLGRYFRRRLNVPAGGFVSLADLDRYGRRTVRIHRIAEDKYFLDFRVS